MASSESQDNIPILVLPDMLDLTIGFNISDDKPFTSELRSDENLRASIASALDDPSQPFSVIVSNQCKLGCIFAVIHSDETKPVEAKKMMEELQALDGLVKVRAKTKLQMYVNSILATGPMMEAAELLYSEFLELKDKYKISKEDQDRFTELGESILACADLGQAFKDLSKTAFYNTPTGNMMNMQRLEVFDQKATKLREDFRCYCNLFVSLFPTKGRTPEEQENKILELQEQNAVLEKRLNEALHELKDFKANHDLKIAELEGVIKGLEERQKDLETLISNYSAFASMHCNYVENVKEVLKGGK